MNGGIPDERSYPSIHTAFFCILLALPFLIMMVSLSRRFQPMLIEKDSYKNE